MESTNEAELTFVYKTVLNYSKYEDYTIQKLQGKFPKDKIYEGYLIDKHYFDYWRKYTDYDDLRNVVQCTQYMNARPTIYKYRKTNRYRGYQDDADQVFFRSPEELYDAVKLNKKSFVLIDYNFWNLICKESGLKERGKMRFSLNLNTITFYFGEFEYCQIITKDNIIDYTKEINFAGSDVVRMEDKEELELKKLLLLYAFEQEMKNKLNNLTYKENSFQECYLISRDWIENYKKLYHYNEICNLIERNERLKRMLSYGYEESKKNMQYIIKNFSIKEKKVLPDYLRDNNTFLVERADEVINKNNNVSFWRNFEIVNEELKNLFSYSEEHQYGFTESSIALCLIACGKVIINLSNDEYNPNAAVLEVGSVNNFDMIFNDEYLLLYVNNDALMEDLSYLITDFIKYQKEYLVFGKDLECELFASNGQIYGKGLKLPLRD